MVLTVVQLAFAIATVPTLSMSLCSLILTHVEFSPHIEACFQNFAAGLIIAAGSVYSLDFVMIDGIFSYE